MIKESFAFIANYLWRESVKNLNAQLSESELKNFSSNDYYYLTTIYYLGKPNFSQVAEALKLTKPAVSVLVRKLSQMSLLEKVQSEDDKRIYFVNITDKGKSIVEGDEELYQAFELLIKEELSSNEKYEFVDTLLIKIVKRLEQMDNLSKIH